MTSAHDAPRFEIVHNPNRRADGKALNVQPWHARFIAGNGEPVWSTENYAHQQSAYDAILVLAEGLGLVDANIEGDVDDRPHLISENGDALPVALVEVGP